MTSADTPAELSTAPRTPASGGEGLNRPLTWAVAAVFAALVAVALVVALAAALVIGATVAIAALVLRLAPRKRAPSGPALLEGRRTAEGWVVEAALRR